MIDHIPTHDTKPLQLPRATTQLAGRGFDTLDGHLEGAAFDTLLRMSRGNDLALFVILLAALKVLLRRIGNRQEIVVAAPRYADEATPAEQNRTVLFRDELDNEMTVKQLLMRVRETVIEGYAHQHAPVSSVGATSVNVFASLAGFHRQEALRDWLASDSHELALSFTATGKELCVQFHYHAGIFHVATIETLNKEYINTLRTMLFAPDAELGALELETLSFPEVEAADEWDDGAPRNQAERLLVEAWQAVFGIERVGIYDHFLELGGHPGLAEEVQKYLAKRGFEVERKHLFLYPSPAQLSRFLKGKNHEDAPFPLTEVQKAYLLGRDSQFELGGVATHGYLEMETVWDIGRLNESLQQVITRHPMLRAVILPSGEGQILPEVPTYVIDVVDLRGHDSEARETVLAAERARMSHEVFVPDQWPLYEFKAFRLSDEMHLLCFSFDLLLLDGASLMIVGEELAAFYQDPQLQLPPLAITFRDYMLQMEGVKKSDAYAQDRAYWLRKVDSFPPAPCLLLKQKPAAVQKPKFQRLSRNLAPEQWQRIKQTAAAMGVTASALLCTMYAEVLAYWSNQPQFGLNVTVFNRQPFHADVNRVVGDFTSLLMLDLDMSAGQSFQEKAKRVQARMLDALDHRLFDGVEFVRELSKHRQHGAQAVMPVVFTSIQAEDQPFGWGEIGAIRYGVSQTSQVYLDNQTIVVDGALMVNWDYVTDLFEPDVIEGMFAQYMSLLEKGEYALPLEPIAGDLALIDAYNRTDDERVVPTTLARLFVEQAKRTPEHPALLFAERRLSYRELHEQSNQVAHYLQALGIGRHDFVGLRAERGFSAIINMFGILKVGAAYVPIDPSWPEERVQFLLNNSGCQLLLEPSLPEKAVVCSTADLPDVNAPDDVAYAIYTSGSTGEPKGVLLSHAAVTNTLQSINRSYHVGEQDRILGLSSMSFDLSVYDIFGALSTGAALIMIDDQRDVYEVMEAIQTHGATIWNSVPAILDLLLDHAAPAFSSETLRLVLLSGDWIPLHLPEKASHHLPHAHLISLGGATEAAIWSICHPITEVGPEWTSIPYGKPLANQTIHVLNADRQPVPVGVEGELYIGGVGLARGYLNDAEKTNAAFFEHEALGRLYRTGDYGVLHHEGEIEFRGRRDHQVKVRGFRIELGEIVHRLTEHVAVKTACVLDREEERDRKTLCAYFVADEPLSASDLRVHLAKHLPAYMIPTYFVQMDELPLTANGKIDRQALPLPSVTREDDSYEEPRTATEETLAVIWQDVLGVEQVGIHDSYLELGGNSIALVQIVMRIHKECGTNVSFREFLDAGTVAQVSRLIESHSHRAQETAYSQKEADPVHLHDPFPLTEVQMAYWIGRDSTYELGGVSTHAYVELEVGLDMERFNRALQKVIDRHPMMRALILPSGEQQILRDVPPYQIEVVDATHLDEAGQSEVILRERERMSHAVFQTDQWPLFEYKAIQTSAATHRLCISVDLIIGDALSMLRIGAELMDYYNDPQLELPALPFTFRDYVLAVNEFKQSDVYKRDKAYWLTKVEDFPSAPALPIKQEPSAIENPHFVRYSKTLSADTWSRLQTAAQEHGVTPSALICTAYAEVLAYWSNQPRLAVNVTVFNRMPFHEDVRKLFGDFTTVLLLGLDFSAHRTFWERAKHVQDTLMEALEHRHYDGIDFVRDIARTRGLGTKAVMPIVFTSMLFNEKQDNLASWHSLGELKMSVSQTSQVFIDHQIMEVDGALSVSWDCVEELFDAGMVDAMFEQYTGILESMGEAKILQPKALDLPLLEDFNCTDDATILPTTLHGLFMEQAERTPDAEAVLLNSEKITYRELHERSNQVAHSLRTLGICAHDRVGVETQRRIETIINILGVLKTGAAYVPINHEFPEERQQYMLANSNAKLLLKSDFIKLDLDQRSTTDCDSLHKLAVSPSDTAYVIYTSGSTGAPKGVEIEHQAAANTILDINRKFRVTEKDRLLNMSSLCFDLSVYDVFGALSTGAALVLIEDPRDMPAVMRTVEAQGVTVWNSVPALMDLAMDSVRDFFANETLRLVLLSGDWIPLSLPEKVFHHFPNAELISLGGATEASIWSIYYPVRHVIPEWKSIPYGRPLANQTFYVLNYEGQQCPVDVPGELYIGGFGLAKGYVGDVEKTNAAFSAHPALGRLYKTGDHGVMRVDGTIEFLGRNDQQIKLRGYRIELGEISTRLSEHMEVRQALVVCQNESSTQVSPYLCAYYTSDNELSSVELRDHLASTLPDYMLPSAFVHLHEMPLTANGKIDRKALPVPSISQADVDEFEAPRNETEALLAAWFAETLDRPKVSLYDSFFDLGGSSISMMRLHSKIEAAFPGRVKPADIVHHQTVAQMALFLTNQP